MKKSEFYSLKRILSKNCIYNIIIGQRSNGKTYSCLEESFKRAYSTDTFFAYIRRFDEEIKPKKMNELFNPFNIFKMTNGEYNKIIFYAGAFYLEFKENDKIIRKRDKPIGYCFSLNTWENDKGADRGMFTSIIFDEFLTRKYYLIDEFVIFMNVISSLIRTRGDCIIFMIANTVNKSCPYFSEMGLLHVKDMKQGTIDVYTYKEGLSVAVEYCAELDKKFNKSAKYFAFDNPKLNMISSGNWEINIYPHAPYSIHEKDIYFKFFIEFENTILCANVVNKNNDIFLFIHEQTRKLKEDDIVFTDKPSVVRNRIYGFDNSKISILFKNCIEHNKICVSNNEIGEILRNFIKLSKSLFI